jgi:hypothetical protein
MRSGALFCQTNQINLADHRFEINPFKRSRLLGRTNLALPIRESLDVFFLQYFDGYQRQQTDQ